MRQRWRPSSVSCVRSPQRLSASALQPVRGRGVPRCRTPPSAAVDQAPPGARDPERLDLLGLAEVVAGRDDLRERLVDRLEDGRGTEPTHIRRRDGGYDRLPHPTTARSRSNCSSRSRCTRTFNPVALPCCDGGSHTSRDRKRATLARSPRAHHAHLVCKIAPIELSCIRRRARAGSRRCSARSAPQARPARGTGCRSWSHGVIEELHKGGNGRSERERWRR